MVLAFGRAEHYYGRELFGRDEFTEMAAVLRGLQAASYSC